MYYLWSQNKGAVSHNLWDMYTDFVYLGVCVCVWGGGGAEAGGGVSFKIHT